MEGIPILRPGFFGGSKEVKIVTLLGGLSHLVGG